VTLGAENAQRLERRHESVKWRALIGERLARLGEVSDEIGAVVAVAVVVAGAGAGASAGASTSGVDCAFDCGVFECDAVGVESVELNQSALEARGTSFGAKAVDLDVAKVAANHCPGVAGEAAWRQ
jgi:hypothetical protein